jgi:hypothetical protein
MCVQAAKALEVCLRTIAPKILTWGQYAEAAINLIQKTVMARDLPEYVPDFTKCVDHFALHAGERRVVVCLKCGSCARDVAAERVWLWGVLA